MHTFGRFRSRSYARQSVDVLGDVLLENHNSRSYRRRAVRFHALASVATKALLTLLVLLTLLGAHSVSHAQRPQIRLDSVFPLGAQAGSDVTVSIAGELTEAATDLVFSHPGIEATQQITPPTEYTTSHRKQRAFDVRVGPDVPDGRYEVRALGPIGLSGPRSFSVSRLIEKRFDPNGNNKQQPFALSIGEIANATARADQRDYYHFMATQGESLLVQVLAERIDSRMDPELAIYDATGNRLARVRQTQSRDPVMTFQPPADGEYTVEVWDATFRGGADYGYRLEVSHRPYVEAIHPAVAQHCVEAEFTIFGFNLPGGVPVSGGGGGLQSTSTTFSPMLDAQAIASALPRGGLAAARIQGGAVQLPIPFSTSQVFMASADATVLRETSNDAIESPQHVATPTAIAGQFYPRRDVDWYQFEAKKGQTFRIDLATHQLGTNADPILRVGRAKDVEGKNSDGKTEFSQIGVSDDVYGSPKTREDRRLFSGTSDSSYRFRANEDGKYLVSVSDQYNASSDDPRLVYGLWIRKESPDFQLVAFAEPERHNDIKVAKANGVSVAAGGTAVLRVRVLPQDGFRGTVEISASNLPAGVESHALSLSDRHTEGFLVLTASKEAKASRTAVQIKGVSKQGKDSISRRVRTAAIRRGNNNIDQTPADVRLTQDLLLAVVESEAAPISIDPLAELVASVGAKLKLPVGLIRHESFKDKEIQVEAGLLPPGMKLAAAKSKAGRVDLDIDLSDKNLKPGRYTVPLATKVKQRRARNQVDFKEAEADLAKVMKILKEREASLALQTAVRERLASVVALTQQSHAASMAESNVPRERLAAKLTELQQAANVFTEQIKASASDVTNAELAAAIDKSQDKLTAIRGDRTRLQAELALSLEPVDELAGLLSAQRSEVDALQKEIESLTKKRDEATVKKNEAEKRVVEVRKAQLEKEAEYYIYSRPVQVHVLSSPLGLVSAKSVKLSPGGSVQIPISIQRRFGFQGRVDLKATFAKANGMSSSPLVLGDGLTSARMEIVAAKDAKLGKQVVTIESHLKFNGVEIRDKSTCVVEVVAGKE